jgi:predicted TIM-barrel fold metal-dependent hydrolase
MQQERPLPQQFGIEKKSRRQARGVAGFILIALALCLALALDGQQEPGKKSGGKKQSPRFTDAQVAEFSSLEPIDTHTHVFRNGPAFQDMLNKLHLHLLSIVDVDDTTPYRAHLEPIHSDGLKFVASSEGRAKLCTTWDAYKFNDSNFAKDAIEGLNQDFGRGAIAVKIWKNVGMEIKNEAGKYILPDDTKLEPIYKDIAAHNKTLVAHLAEPDAAWNPVVGSPYSEYYREENPAWNMALKPDVPSKQAILDARDHVLSMNPKLRLVGAHFGSMEADVDQIAARLDKYPNFAVDTASRTLSLELQPREKVRNFILKYQNRIVYGTDLGFYPDATAERKAREWESYYATDWRYYATDDKFEVGGKEVEGLALPHAVLKKLYHDNAAHWFPGIYTNSKTASMK